MTKNILNNELFNSNETGFFLKIKTHTLSAGSLIFTLRIC